MSIHEIFEFFISPIIGALMGFLGTYAIFVITKKSEIDWESKIKSLLSKDSISKESCRYEFQEKFWDLILIEDYIENYEWRKIYYLYKKLREVAFFVKKESEKIEYLEKDANIFLKFNFDIVGARVFLGVPPLENTAKIRNINSNLIFSSLKTFNICYDFSINSITEPEFYKVYPIFDHPYIFIDEINVLEIGKKNDLKIKISPRRIKRQMIWKLKQKLPSLIAEIVSKSNEENLFEKLISRQFA